MTSPDCYFQIPSERWLEHHQSKLQVAMFLTGKKLKPHNTRFFSVKILCNPWKKVRYILTQVFMHYIKDGSVQISAVSSIIAATYHGQPKMTFHWCAPKIAMGLSTALRNTTSHQPLTRIWGTILHTLKKLRQITHKPTYYCAIESKCT